MLDAELVHLTLRAKEPWTINSSDIFESILLSIEVRSFLTATVVVISFFIIESPDVRGPLENKKDECQILPWRGTSTSSTTLKSKQLSDGQTISQKRWKKKKSNKVKSHKYNWSNFTGRQLSENAFWIQLKRHRSPNFKGWIFLNKIHLHFSNTILVF